MNIGIISLGLIGGSILKALKHTEHAITCVTRNEQTRNKVINDKLAWCCSDSIKDLKSCNVVFVASPIFRIPEILDQLEDIVSTDCIVLDCGSVKEYIMKKERSYKFIGSHPMAGKELSGFENSDTYLFRQAKWVLCPQYNIQPNDLQIVYSLIKEMGAIPLIVGPKEHDEAVALISHMPLLLSEALLQSAKGNKLALKLASSGFRDMTRICMTNLGMALDMRKYNQYINKAVDELLKSIEFLYDNTSMEVIEDLKKLRQSMYNTEGKNIL